MAATDVERAIVSTGAAQQLGWHSPPALGKFHHQCKLYAGHMAAAGIACRICITMASHMYPDGCSELCAINVHGRGVKDPRIMGGIGTPCAGTGHLSWHGLSGILSSIFP